MGAATSRPAKSIEVIIREMLGAELNINSYLDRISVELNRLDSAAIERWADEIYQAWEDDASVYIIGNGGSATTATHMAEDLAKSTLDPEDLLDEDRKRLRVLSLTDNVGWMLAVANDLSYEQVFVQQLMNLARPGDLLIAISGSGNSQNIVTSVEWAERHGVKTFGLTGFDGGKVARLCQDGVHVPLDDMGMVESIHLGLFHWVLNDVYARINACGRYANGN